MSTPTASPGRFPTALSVRPVSDPVRGTVILPGSKSITNRALLVAALSRGYTVLENALYCDDSRYLAGALRDLGVEVHLREAERCMEVRGVDGLFPRPEGQFHLGNAGTSTRFLTAALTTAPGHYVVDGDHRMRQRPIGELVEALTQLGARVTAPTGCPPVTIGAPELVDAPRRAGDFLEGGTVLVGGRTSSQFISAILMAGPYARHDVEVVVEGEFVSKPYIEITLEVMRQFGASAWMDEGRADGRTAFHVRSARGYRGRGEYVVEGDASTASYFLAAAAITGGRIRVEGVGRLSIQGDARFADVLAAMGCHVKKDADVIGIAGDLLQGVDVDCGDMPDIVPTLAVVALFARGRTRIRNVAHLRFKESDRIRSVATELRKLGGRVKELDDGLEVEESELRGSTLETWKDHRLAMALSLVGLRIPDVEIREPGVVEKSFPEYFETLRSIGIEVTP